MNIHTSHYCTLALHYTELMKKRELSILRFIHAPLMERFYYDQAITRLMSEWLEAKETGTMSSFIYTFGKFVQPMLNRLCQLKEMHTNKNTSMPVLFDYLFEISYQMSLNATDYQPIHFPGIKTLQS